MNLVHNERVKLTATWINTLAAAFIATGFFAPAAALLYGLSTLPIGPARVLGLAAACLAIGTAIHMWARKTLGRLRE